MAEQDPESAWRILASDPVYQNPHLEVRSEAVRIPGDDRVRHWITVRRKKAVVIAPVTASGKFVLIRQARIPVRKLSWEFPAGQFDGPEEPTTENLEITAVRELAEETGYVLNAEGTLTPLGFFYSSHGFTDETQYLFLARPVQPSPDGRLPEHTEVIAETREFAVEELRRMIAENIIQDANTLAVFARLIARGLVAT
ncbi:MAG: NUDIX hydrolase [Verrucomicrobia bacterium]|nr:NUDIX hydrolase [Verrucomicrobiota bacterium]